MDATNQKLDIAYTQAAAAEIALRLILEAAKVFNEIASELENEAEITRKEFLTQADRDDFDTRR